MGKVLDTAAALALIESWVLSLRAARRAEGTIATYLKGPEQYGAWCIDQDRPFLDRTSLRAWTAERLADGAAPTTLRARQTGIRQFTRWLVDEDEIPADPFAGVRPPKTDEQVVQPLSVQELQALLAACSVPRSATADEKLMGRRDEALLRIMVESGARASEVVDMRVEDVNLSAGTALIRRGKGGRGRPVPLGPQAAQALDRYLRLRRSHRLAGTSALWLGTRGRGFTYRGLYGALEARAKAAGVEGFHPHRLRHTAAHRWLAAGGSEHGLMAVAGWSSPAMLGRYTRARASERAAEEARKLNLGEL